MIKEQVLIQQEGILNLQDFLEDEKADELSKYLSLSLESVGENTKINITTLEDVPTTYTSTLIGVPYTDLQCLLEENLDLAND